MKYTEKKVGAQSVYLLEPETYMNLCGPAVREFIGYFGRQEALGALEDSLLVVHDDLDLQEGRLRFRARGSSGGHRGVQSIAESLASEAFGRLKLGIGRRPGRDAAEYVLETLSGDSEVAIRDVCLRAAKSLPLWLREGTRACANQYNQPGGGLKIGGLEAGSHEPRNQSHKKNSLPGGQA